jgi:hypothetical protein
MRRPSASTCAFRVDAGDLGENDVDIACVAHDGADRRGDVRRRQARGGDLVKQRLEQMVIVLVDEGDVEWRIRQRRGGGKSAKSGAENDHARARGGIGAVHDQASSATRGLRDLSAGLAQRCRAVQ